MHPEPRAPSINLRTSIISSKKTTAVFPKAAEKQTPADRKHAHVLETQAPETNVLERNLSDFSENVESTYPASRKSFWLFLMVCMGLSLLLIALQHQ